MAHSPHIPVLLDETLACLDPRPGQVLLDCTAGLGGHAATIAQRLAPGGTVVLFDLDAGNLAEAAARVTSSGGAAGIRVETVHASFAEAPTRLRDLGLAADLLLADLGFASPQVDDPSRGFSFSRDGPLDMRLNPQAGPSAADLVNTLPQAELARIIKDYGEERHAGLVASRIVEARKQSPLVTTAQLAEVVRGAVRRSPGGNDPATRTFQALRIAVNDEIGNLAALLDAIRQAGAAIENGRPTWLAPGARVAIIAFHSLEDRPVKQAFGEIVAKGRAQPLTRSVVQAGDAELGTNPRAGSAKLRAIRMGASAPTAQV